MTNPNKEIGNPWAERIVLQALMEDWNRKAEYDLTPFDFNDTIYNLIFRLLDKYNGNVELVNWEFIKSWDNPEHQTRDDLQNWFSTAITINFEECLLELKKISKQKKQGIIAKKLQSVIMNWWTEWEIMQVANELYETETIKRQDNESIKQEIINDAFHLQGSIKRYLTSYKEIDDITWGWYPWQLITIAARTWVWKTMIALNFIANQIQAWHKCMFFSLEMWAKEIYQRLYSRFWQISISKIKWYFELTEDETKRLGKAIDTMDEYESRLSIIDDKFSIWEIVAEIRKAYNKNAVDIVYIDYVWLIESKWESRNYQIANITRELKKLTQLLKIPIVILAQMNRQIENRFWWWDEPKLSDLRDSWAIEQDSNVVLMLEKVDDDCLKVHIRKNRNWPLGTTYQKLTGKYMTIWEFTDKERQFYLQQQD